MRFLTRRISQALGAILPNAWVPGFLSLSLYQGPLKGACTPLFNCYACPSAFFSCPIGSIQHFAARGMIPFYAVGTLAAVGAAAGRMTCGVLCPFGFLQELLYKLRTRKFSLPRWTRHLRYVVLAVLVVLVPWLTGENWFSKLCPAGTLEAGLPWAAGSADVRAMIRSLFWVKIGILALFFAASATVKRPFCRTTCPLGAILSLFNRSSLLQIAWNPATCTDCGECRKICPVDIRPSLEAAGPDCIRCLDCTSCPSLKLTTVFHRDPFGVSAGGGQGEKGLAESPAP